MSGSCTLPCNVPSDKNIEATTVQSTSTAQTANCKTGYVGEPQYTCINGVFAIVSGACSLPCANPSSSGSCDSACPVPSSANMDLSITTVQPTANPISIGCKSGYTGTPTYTCINGNFAIASGTCCEIASGTCQYDGCAVPTCAQENYQGYSPASGISCINLRDILGQDNVSYGASGIYSNNFTGYHSQGVSLPAYSLRWKCNNNGVMSIDIERDCPWYMGKYAYEPYEYLFLHNHGFEGDGGDFYFDDDNKAQTGYCCGGGRVSDIGACPWPNW
jgi:hypothetical protein